MNDNDQPGTSSATGYEEIITNSDEEQTSLNANQINSEIPGYITLWRMEMDLEKLMGKIAILLDLRMIEVRHRNRLQRNSHQYEKLDDTFYYEEVSAEFLENANDAIKEITAKINRKRAKSKIMEQRIKEYKTVLEAESKENDPPNDETRVTEFQLYE